MRDAETAKKPFYRSAWFILALVIIFFIIYSGYLLAPRTTGMKGRIHAGPDPKNIVWSMMWVHRSVLNDPLHFFRANIYYPHQDGFAYSDTILVPSLLTLPFRLFTTEPTVLFNLCYWITFAMSGVFMFLLVRQLTRNDFISLFCGIFYAFSPYRLDNVTHLQYTSHQWLPLMILFIILFFRHRKFVFALGIGLTTFATALSCGAYFIMALFPFGMLTVLFLIARTPDWKQLGILMAGGAVGLLLMFPFYYTSYQIISKNRVELSNENRVVFSPDVYDFFKQPKYMTSAPYSLLPEKIKTTYFSLFPGFVAGISILIAFFYYFRRKDPESFDKPGKGSISRILRYTGLSSLSLVLLNLISIGIFTVNPTREPVHGFNHLTLLLGLLLLSMAADSLVATLAFKREEISLNGFLFRTFSFLAVTSAVLALGPYVFINNQASGANVFQYFMTVIPGIKVVRQVMHYNTFFMLFMVPVVGMVLGRLLSTSAKSLRYGFYGLVSVLILLEYQTDMSRDFAEVPVASVPTYDYLRAEGPRSPILELPMWDYPHHPEADRHFWSMFHWNPMVNGWFSYFPLDYYQTLDNVADFPSRSSIEYIQDNYKIRFIVVRLSHYGPSSRQKMLELFSQEWSEFKLKRQFEYFWVFEYQKWDDSMFYATDPPEVTGPVSKRY